MNPEKIQHWAKEVFNTVRSNREHLHRNPELSFEEYKTMEYVASELARIGIPFEKGICKTGIVGLITSDSNPEQWIGLRADLDALPIHEENVTSYTSLNVGVMHACGHDVHTSILLGAAEILWKHKSEIPVSIKLIFQPGEELAPGGASLLIEAGVLENPKVEKMVALHVFPDMHVGKVGIKSGLYMASSDEIHISIEGVGGHGALPEKCINPITIAARIINDTPEILKAFYPKEIPYVLSYGRIEGLGTTNVIPSLCTIKGTFRTMNEIYREDFFIKIQAFLAQLEVDFGTKITLNRVKGYPFLVNDESLTKQVRFQLESQLGKDNVEDLALRMTAEDFAFYSHLVPVCFFRLGVGDPFKEVNYGVHHPKFDIHPDALKVGVEALLSIVFNMDNSSQI